LDGKLYIRNCPENLEKKYAFFPDTRYFTWEQKQFKSFYQNIFKSLDFIDFPETLSVGIPRNVESMLVNCGEESRLIFHVAKAEKKSDISNQNQQIKNPNILFLFIDSVSRRQFHRRLPKTVSTLEHVLRSYSDQVEFSEFFRYGAIAGHTGPNTCMLFTGSAEGTKPIIWKDVFQSGSYVIMRTDNACEDWGVNYLNQTVSEYFNHEMIAPFCHPDYFPHDGSPHGNFKGPFSLRKRCLLGNLVHEHVFEYFKSFKAAYEGTNRPWFATLNFLEAHEGSGENLASMDDSLSNFFSEMSLDEYENTLIFLISDHGLHMGPFYLFTQIGYLEHTNPLLMTISPKKLFHSIGSLKSSNISKALIHNEQALMSAKTMHATLNCVLHGFENCSNQLFSETIFSPQPYSLNCTDIGIPNNHLCTCS
jgi:hypothetical protein